MGSCAAWGFYSELNSVTNTISFAAADSVVGWNTIGSSPEHSFMRYWQKAVDENTGFNFDEAENSRSKLTRFSR
jgi:hypothetical protein